MENDVNEQLNTIKPKQQPLTTITKTQTDNPKQRYDNTYSSLGNEFGNMTTIRSLYSSNIDPQFDNIYVSFDPSMNNYTKNAKFIKNKQMIMIPRCLCEMYRYNYYQMNQFNLQQFIPIKHKKSTLYKTTIFRNHHLVNDSKNKPKKANTDNVNVSQPKPKKKKYKNYLSCHSYSDSNIKSSLVNLVLKPP